MIWRRSNENMLNMRLLCLLCLVHIIQSGINAHSATKELLNKLIREYSKEIPKSVTIIQETTHTPRQKDSLTIPMLKFNVPLELYLWNSDVDSDFTVPQMGHRHEGKHNIIMTASVAQTLKVFDWIFSKRLRKRHSTFAILLQNESNVELSKFFHQHHLFHMPRTAVFNLVGSKYRGYLKSFCSWETGFHDLGETSDLLIQQMLDADILEGFKCFPVRATAFHVPPTSIVVKDVEGEQKYQGVEAKLFRTIAQKLGFPYVIGPPISKKRWSGLGADISANLTDVGWADIFLRPSLSKEYTTMYDQDGACFLLKQPGEFQSLNKLLAPLDQLTWAGVIFVCFASLVFVTTYGTRVTEAIEMENSSYTLFVIGVVLGQSQSKMNIFRANGLRIFCAIFTLSIFTVSCGYKGGLASSLTIPYTPQKIDTIHDIALSGLPVLSGDVFDEIFESRNPDIKKIAKVHTTYKTFYGGLNSVLDGKATLLVSEALLKYYIKERFTGSDGRTSVYIARECLKSYRVVFRVQLDSLLSPKFNPIIDKLKQFGIVNHWKNEDLDNVRRVSASGSGTRGREDEERNLEDNRAIKLDIMQGPFLLFLGMLLASSLAFAIEIIAWKTFGMSIKSDQ